MQPYDVGVLEPSEDLELLEHAVVGSLTFASFLFLKDYFAHLFESIFVSSFLVRTEIDCCERPLAKLFFDDVLVDEPVPIM